MFVKTERVTNHFAARTGDTLLQKKSREAIS